LKARAMSNARLVLKAGAVRTIRARARPDGTVEKSPMGADGPPEQTALYGSKYVGPRELSVRLSDVPPDGLTIPWSELEQPRPNEVAR
jgi:hypothetical protein